MSAPKKLFIIPVFIPHAGCPHQCIFCNQKSITHVKKSIPSPDQIHLHIQKFLSYKGSNRDHVQISFYGGNFLGLHEKHIKSLLNQANEFVKSKHVDSLRFSTRPDTISSKNLDMLNKFPVKTIELGVQSMNDNILQLSKRGHTSNDTIKAVTLLKHRKYEFGLQMMVGLPGDTNKTSLETCRQLIELQPDFVRIYPTIVLKSSPLARLYDQGKYEPMALEPCVSLVKELYLMFMENNIPVIRMGLQASQELDTKHAIAAGPYHPAFGHMVYSEIFLDKAIDAIKSSKLLNKKNICLWVHPKNISKIRGMKNKNIEIMKNMFNFESLQIIPDENILQTNVIVKSIG